MPGDVTILIIFSQVIIDRMGNGIFWSGKTNLNMYEDKSWSLIPKLLKLSSFMEFSTRWWLSVVIFLRPRYSKKLSNLYLQGDQKQTMNPKWSVCILADFKGTDSYAILFGLRSVFHSNKFHYHLWLKSGHRSHQPMTI